MAGRVRRVAVLAFLGGWLIGLAPVCTVALVVVLAIASLAWILVAGNPSVRRVTRP